MARREIDYSNPWRMMSMGVLKENAKQAFRNKTGIIVFKTGGCSMTIDVFELSIYCTAGNFTVRIEYDKGVWEIIKK